MSFFCSALPGAWQWLKIGPLTYFVFLLALMVALIDGLPLAFVTGGWA